MFGFGRGHGRLSAFDPPPTIQLDPDFILTHCAIYVCHLSSLLPFPYLPMFPIPLYYMSVSHALCPILPMIVLLPFPAYG